MRQDHKVGFSKTLGSERGQATLLLSLAFAAISAILVVQMGSAYQFMNTHHARKKSYLSQQEIMKELALQVKKGLDEHIVEGKCSGKTIERKIGAKHSICVPKNNAFCVREGENDSSPGIKHCVSLKNRNIKLSEKPYRKGKANSKTARNTFTKHKSKVRVRVPKGSNSPALECTDENPCVRLTLCPPNKANCNENSAVATQVVRLGVLNNTEIQDKIARVKELEKNNNVDPNLNPRVRIPKEMGGFEKSRRVALGELKSYPNPSYASSGSSYTKKKKKKKKRNYQKKDYKGPGR